VLHTWSTNSDDATVDPNGPGRQAEDRDTGPLDTKRMQTVDEEFLDGR